jgi:hypothetical protein
MMPPSNLETSGIFRDEEEPVHAKACGRVFGS